MASNNLTFFKHGDMYLLRGDTPQNRLKFLPPAVYLVSANEEIGFYLEEIPNFTLPKKIYGDMTDKANRILDTFEDRPKTTGVLFSGEKGAGKTLLTQQISILGQERGFPTIVVNQPYGGDRFNTFIQNINQPCIILFDEFEKVYDTDAQKGLLTLLDGIFSTKKLMLLTTNERIGINEHLQNRPGRLYYNLEFNGLDTNFILEYGKDKLKNQNYVSSLGILASMVKPISFDILQAVVEESNRYNESPVKVLEMLNVKPITSYRDEYVVALELKNGKKPVYDKEVSINPFRDFTVSYTINNKKTPKGKDNYTYHDVYVTPDNLIAFDGIKGRYEYETEEFHLVITLKPYDKRSNFQKYEHLAKDEVKNLDGPAGEDEEDGKHLKKNKKIQNLRNLVFAAPASFQEFTLAEPRTGRVKLIKGNKK